MTSLPILQYPRTANAIVTVTHDLFRRRSRRRRRLHHHAAGKRDRPGQRHRLHDLAEPDGTSTITVYLRLNYDADKALTEINTKVNSVLNQLPLGDAAAGPDGQDRPDHRRHVYRLRQRHCWRRTRSPTICMRVVQPRLQAVPGVQTAELLGGKNFALRAWLDPQKLAAFGLTATDVIAGADRATTTSAGARHHQGPDGPGQSDRDDQPAFASRNSAISSSSRSDGADRPAEGRRQRHARRGRLRHPRSTSTARARSISASRSRRPRTCST